MTDSRQHQVLCKYDLTNKQQQITNPSCASGWTNNFGLLFLISTKYFQSAAVAGGRNTSASEGATLAAVILRHTLIIISTFFSGALSFGQTSKEQDFMKAVREIVSRFSKRDSNGLSKYINKEAGIYILYVNGVRETYLHAKTMGFSDTTFPNAPFYDDVKYSPIKYTKLPNYNCDNSRWSKTGAFVDTTKIDHLLSKTAKWLNKNYGEKIPSNTISAFISLESISRRIIVTDNGYNDIIFYLSFINNRWWLTILDKATCDCSS